MKAYDQSTQPSYLIKWVAKKVNDGRCHKTQLLMLLDRQHINSTYMKISQKNYDEHSGGYIFKDETDYPTRNDVSFLQERMKIEKSNKLYVICITKNRRKNELHIKALNQVLHHGLMLEKVNRVTEFNQQAWLNPYIDMNTELRT